MKARSSTSWHSPWLCECFQIEIHRTLSIETQGQAQEPAVSHHELIAESQQPEARIQKLKAIS
jgi:hypothetical protein